MATIVFKEINNKGWQECGEVGILEYCWWGDKKSAAAMENGVIILKN